MFSQKKILFLFLILILTPLVFIFYKRSNIPPVTPTPNEQPNPTIPSQPENPILISTNPDERNLIILPTQVIELNFSHSIENSGEFKYKIEPAIDLNTELINNRKTVKITPKTSYNLGSSYTLFISPETKFDNGKRLKDEVIFKFKTIEYRGV